MSSDNDKRELLKLKQGLIEQSASIDEGGYNVAMPQTLPEKIKNWLWHSKLLVGALIALLLVGFAVYFFFFVAEKPDIVIYSAENYTTTTRQLLENNMKNYCSDYDGDGKVKITVRQSGDDTALAHVDLYSEIDSGNAVIFIGKKEKLTELYDDYASTESKTIFSDLTEIKAESANADEEIGYLIDIKDTDFGKKYKILSTEIYIAVKNTDDENEEKATEFLSSLVNGKQ